MDACKTFLKWILNTPAQNRNEMFSDYMIIALKKTNQTNDSKAIEKTLLDLCTNDIFTFVWEDYTSFQELTPTGLFNGTCATVLLCFMYTSLLMAEKISKCDPTTLLHVRVISCIELLTLAAVFQGNEIFVWTSLLLQLTTLCIIQHRKKGFQGSFVMFVCYATTVALFGIVYSLSLISWPHFEISSSCVLIVGYGSKCGLIFASLMSDNVASPISGFIGAFMVIFSFVCSLEDATLSNIILCESIVGMVAAICMIFNILDSLALACGSYIGILSIVFTTVFTLGNDIIQSFVWQYYIKNPHLIHLNIVLLASVANIYMQRKANLEKKHICYCIDLKTCIVEQSLLQVS